MPDAVEAAPNIYKVILENERTRVFTILLKPSCSSPAKKCRSIPMPIMSSLF